MHTRLLLTIKGLKGGELQRSTRGSDKSHNRELEKPGEVPSGAAKAGCGDGYRNGVSMNTDNNPTAEEEPQAEETQRKKLC